jgi:hypothetical protein
MKKIFLILFSIVLFGACDDGDIILTTFDFEDESLQLCTGSEGYVFFKINSTTAESISLQLGTSNNLFLEDSTIVTVLDGNAHFINYRRYTSAPGSDYFCSNIPPTNPEVTVDYFGGSGVATLEVVTLLDDNDPIPFVDSDSETEEGFGDLDMDGIPNYYDFDDDGDNVPTSVEVGIDPLNPKDTDGDGIEDYLDPDDDNDGVLTRHEDRNMDLDPTNDVTGNAGPDYLNDQVADQTIVDAYREHSYNLISSISLLLSNIVLSNGNEEISQETLDMGDIPSVLDTTIFITPEF